jgi:hypothetical protein
MRPNEIKECFRQIERDANVNDISLMGICAWPLIRSVLYSEFSKSPSLKNKTGLSSLGKILRQSFHHGVNSIFRVKRKFIARENNNQVKILAFGHSPHYTKVNGQKHRSDRIMDPVTSLFGTTGYQKYVLGSLPLGHYIDRNLSFRIRRHNGNFLLDGTLESGLLSLLGKHGIDIESFNKLMATQSKVFLGSYLKTRKILEKNPEVKTVFLSVWYAPIMMGVTAAAREMSIRVVDVQHGAEISSHAMYCDWTDVPGGGYLTVPNNFWCWDENFEQTINNSFKNNENHLGIRNCPTWLNYRMNQIQRANLDLANQKLKSSYKYVLLYTLQPPCFETPNRIPDFLIDFLKQENPDVQVCIRRHPNDPEDKGELRLFQDAKFNTAWSVVSSSEDLVHSLCASTHHLTRFSSVCYEAEKLGIPTLLFGPEALEFYSTEIQESRFHWTPGTSMDLRNFLIETKVRDRKLVADWESIHQIRMLTEIHS